MAWRTVIIGSECRISLKRSQLSVERADGVVSVPVEDIAVCVLEHRGITITTAVLSALSDAGAAVAVCNNRHLPNGLMLPFHNHSRQSQIAALQISWSEPFRKRVWQKIIQTKIINQGHCLARHDPVQGKTITEMAKRVVSGDVKNREAHAARIYWPALMGKGFIRGANDLPNAFLNYGYTVIRACVARAVVGAGLLPCFGLHHNNDLNAFNLADDLIEPFRPFVDAVVIGLMSGREQQGDLTKSDRAVLAELPATQVLIGNELQTILNATERSAESLVRAIRQKETGELCLPEFSM